VANILDYHVLMFTRTQICTRVKPEELAVKLGSNMINCDYRDHDHEEASADEGFHDKRMCTREIPHKALANKGEEEDKVFPAASLLWMRRGCNTRPILFSFVRAWSIL
jgi:hypothetical protein